MKNRIVILIGVIISCVLISCLCLKVQAEETQSSGIPEKGDLYIHKYYLEDLESAKNHNEGTIIEEEKLPEGVQVLPGVKFKLFKVKMSNGLYPEGNNFVLDTNKLILTEGKQTYDLENVGSSPFTTNDDGIAEAKGLEQGVYVVKEVDSGLIEIGEDEIDINPHQPFIVHVPMTNPDGNGWLTEVHVYLKNEGLVLEKISDSELSVSVGDTISYRINNKVPVGVYNKDPNINSQISYAIHDTLDDALTLDQNSLKVYCTDSKDADVSALEPMDKECYEIVNNFKVVFTERGRETISKNKYIAIVFKATVNQNLLNKDTTEIGNKANVEFKNQNGQDLTKDSESVVIHTGNIKINKIDARNKKQLEGVSFQIASSLENAKKGYFLKKDSESKIIDFNEDDYEQGIDWKETTDQEGTAIFKGLKEYKAKMTNGEESENKEYLSYWLVEVGTLNGYHLLDEPVKVTFREDVENYTLEITITNSQKGLLPKTGSVTSLLLSIIGIVIIGGGVIHLMINNKKMKSE